MIDLESNTDNGINLWSNLLKDVKEKSSKTTHIPICLLVLGNAGSGKSTLIARLQKSDPKYGSGLEFDYIEIKDESIDENKKLNIWISSGDPYHANLLKYALNENNFGYSCCMITISFSEPWNILDNLEEWLKILKMHIERLKLADADMKFYKESLVRHFQEYCEPDLEKEKQIISSKRRDNDFNYLHPSATDDSEKYFVPLEEEILENNLGIPIIVVITKTDSLFNLEQEHDYNDDKFDFIQMHLRKTCLKYGASLCYTSLKDDRNCDLLLNYLLHRCYGFSLINAASIIEKDAIFIPTGWDSGKKINILTENLSDDIKKHSYNSLITKPLSIVRANAQNRLTEPEIAEDEQVFLMKQQVLIQRIKSSATIEGNNKDVSKLGSSVNLSTTRNRKNLSNSSSSIGNTSNTSAQQANEGVLANFFSSLLNKRGVTTGSPTLNQQANSCEILRDDSISENDECQKDDLLSNSQNNQDSTQLKMTEICDVNEQGKIDVSIDLSNSEYTLEILNSDQNRLNILNEKSINLKIENNSHFVCDDNINNEDHCKDLNLEANNISIEHYDEITKFELNKTENALSMCPSILNSESEQIENEKLLNELDLNTTVHSNESVKKPEIHILEQTKLNLETSCFNSKDDDINNKEILIKKDIEITDKFELTEFSENISDLEKFKNIASDNNLIKVNNSINYLNEETIKQNNERFSNNSEGLKNEENILGEIEVNRHSSNNETLNIIGNDLIKNVEQDDECSTKTTLKDAFQDSNILPEFVENKTNDTDKNTMIPDNFNLEKSDDLE